MTTATLCLLVSGLVVLSYSNAVSLERERGRERGRERMRGERREEGRMAHPTAPGQSSCFF